MLTMSCKSTLFESKISRSGFGVVRQNSYRKHDFSSRKHFVGDVGENDYLRITKIVVDDGRCKGLEYVVGGRRI